MRKVIEHHTKMKIYKSVQLTVAKLGTIIIKNCLKRNEESLRGKNPVDTFPLSRVQYTGG